MSESERALRDEIAANYAEMRDFLTKFDNGENITREDRKRFDDADAELTRSKGDLDRLLKTKGTSGIAGLRGASAGLTTAEDLAFDEYMRTGDTHRLSEVRGTEYRAESTDLGSMGHTIPLGFWSELQTALKSFSGFQDYYRVIETDTGAPMAFAAIDPTSVTADILAENTTISNTDYVFGAGMLRAWLYSELVLASFQIVQDSSQSVQDFVTVRWAEAVGRKLAAHSATGAGAASQQPVGVFTALSAKGAASGASGGWVAGQASSVKIPLIGNADGVGEVEGNVLSNASITSLIQAVDPAYWDNAQFYMNSTQFTNQKNVADQMGRPLYPELRQANPQLAGFNVKVVQATSDLVANTIGGPIFGNLQRAMVRRVAKNSTMMVLRERYAAELQVGYLGYLREDHVANDLRAMSCLQASNS
jgi:HK97 family phage major capsid protein